MDPVDPYRLVLVRHAKSDYPPGVRDHDRPLNARGARDAPEIGAWLSAHVSPRDPLATRVLVSSALRAQVTWALASEHLDGWWDAVEVAEEPRIYEASAATLARVVAEQRSSTRTVVLVGHNPGLADLILRRCVPDDVSRSATAKFPTSAVAVLEASAPWAWPSPATRP